MKRLNDLSENTFLKIFFTFFSLCFLGYSSYEYVACHAGCSGLLPAGLDHAPPEYIFQHGDEEDAQA